MESILKRLQNLGKGMQKHFFVHRVSESSFFERYVEPKKAETPYDVPVPRGSGISR